MTRPVVKPKPTPGVCHRYGCSKPLPKPHRNAPKSVPRKWCSHSCAVIVSRLNRVIARGRCADCHKKFDGDALRCRACLDKDIARHKTLRARRKAAGCCLRCGKKHDDGKTCNHYHDLM